VQRRRGSATMQPVTSAPTWIPDFLRHLRTDRRGIPVPWINLWGDPLTNPDMISVRPDATVRMDAVFMDDDDQDVPDFTKQNFGRQRMSTVYGLCQVCGREVPWSRRFLVWANLSVQVINLDGEAHAAVIEPWLDERCAMFALERCPALIRRRRGEELAVLKVTSARQVALTVAVGWIEGVHAKATQANPVALTVKILAPQRSGRTVTA
jgi:hypothetical protein